MGDFTRINAPRVHKILGLLDLIDKSCQSQRPSVDERQLLLKPLHDWFDTEIPDVPEEAFERMRRVEPKPAGTALSSHWSSAVEMARTAPLEDVAAAMQVFVARVEQELFERRKP